MEGCKIGVSRQAATTARSLTCTLSAPMVPAAWSRNRAIQPSTNALRLDIAAVEPFAQLAATLIEGT
jgi:hypothetical protein